MTQNAPETLAEDTLWGVAEIAAYIGRERRTTYYLIAKKKIPAKKIGHKLICARKSELDRALANNLEP